MIEYTQAETLEALPEIPCPPWADLSALRHAIPGAGRAVWAEGYPDGRLMVVLDNPGMRENANGESFVCGTRQTLFKTVAEAGIARHELYITSLLKFRPTRQYDKHQAWAVGVPLLDEQVQCLRPTVMVCMGTVVLRALSGADNEVKAMRNQSWEYDGVPVVVTYHPLAVRRRPGLSRPFMSDLRRAAEFLGVVEQRQKVDEVGQDLTV